MSDPREYTPAERTRVARFYAIGEGIDFFSDFFNNTGQLTGVWVKRFITDAAALPQAKSVLTKRSTNAKPDERNTITSLAGAKLLLDLSMLSPAGEPTTIALVDSPTAQNENYVVGARWLAPNESIGYDQFSSLTASLTTDTPNAYLLRFDPTLLAERHALRLVEHYAASEAPRRTADGEKLEPLPVHIDFEMDGRPLVRYALSGYLVEEVAQPTFGAQSRLAPLMCGVHMGGAMFNIGERLGFVEFTSRQQIRAAVVLHVARLFCFASVWRVYFAFVNSLVCSLAYGEPVGGTTEAQLRAVRLRTCATTMGGFIVGVGTEGFFEIAPWKSERPDPYQLLDPATQRRVRNVFAGWDSPEERTRNCATAAERIEKHSFVETATYAAQKREERDDSAQKNDELRQLIALYANQLGALEIPPTAKRALQINPVAPAIDPLQAYKLDVATRLKAEALLVAEKTPDYNARRIFGEADRLRRKAQDAMTRQLRDVADDGSPQLRQKFVRLLFAQRFLAAAGVLTNLMLRLGPDTERATIVAPLRASERTLAKFAASTLLALLPAERRTSGKQTEEYAAALEAIVGADGGNGQVPVPDSQVLHQMMAAIEISDEYGEDEYVVAVASFYAAERTYFADIADVPWTSKSVDELTFRNVILDRADSNLASLYLAASIDQLQRLGAQFFGRDAEPARRLVSEIDDATLRQLSDVVNQVVTSVAQSVAEAQRTIEAGDRNGSLFVVALLRGALAQTRNYFEATRTALEQYAITDVPGRTNIMIRVEENIVRVLQLYRVDIAMPQRQPVVEAETDDLLRTILGTDRARRMDADAQLPFGIGFNFKRQKRERERNDDDDDDDNGMLLDIYEPEWLKEIFAGAAQLTTENLWQTISENVTNDSTATLSEAQKGQLLLFLQQAFAQTIEQIFAMPLVERQKYVTLFDALPPAFGPATFGDEQATLNKALHFKTALEAYVKDTLRKAKTRFELGDRPAQLEKAIGAMTRPELELVGDVIDEFRDQLQRLDVRGLLLGVGISEAPAVKPALIAVLKADDGIVRVDEFAAANKLLGEWRRVVDDVRALFVNAKAFASLASTASAMLADLNKGEATLAGFRSLERLQGDVRNAFEPLFVFERRQVEIGLKIGAPVIFELFEALKRIKTNIEAQLAAYRKRLRADDAATSEAETKKRDLERLKEAKMQIEAVKGQYQDSVKALLDEVKRAEQVEGEASRLDKKLATLLSNADKFVRTAAQFEARFAAADKSLSNLPNVDDLQQRAQAQFEKVDDVRKTVDELADLYRQAKDAAKQAPELRRKIDAAQKDFDTSARALEEYKKTLAAVQRSNTAAENTYNQELRQYNETTEKIGQFDTNLDALAASAKQTATSVKQRFDFIKAEVDTIDDLATQIREKKANFERRKAESELAGVQARKVISDLTRDVANTTTLEAQLAQLVYSRQTDENDFRELADKINSLDSAVKSVMAKEDKSLNEAVNRKINGYLTQFLGSKDLQRVVTSIARNTEPDDDNPITPTTNKRNRGQQSTTTVNTTPFKPPNTSADVAPVDVTPVVVKNEKTQTKTRLFEDDEDYIPSFADCLARLRE